MFCYSGIAVPFPIFVLVHEVRCCEWEVSLGFRSSCGPTGGRKRRLHVAAANAQHAACETQHTTCNILHATCDMQHSSYSIQHTTCNTCNIRRATYDVQHTTCNIQHTTCDVRRNERHGASAPLGTAGAINPALCAAARNIDPFASRRMGASRRIRFSWAAMTLRTPRPRSWRTS
jgi:hypothetical protein